MNTAAQVWVAAVLVFLLSWGLAGQDNPFSRKRVENKPKDEAKEEKESSKDAPESPEPSAPKTAKPKAKESIANAVPIEVNLACEADLTKERLQEMADLFASFADDWWVFTEGNSYVKKVVATDKSKSGNVRVSAADVEKEFAKGGGITYNPGRPGAYMQVAGRCSVFTFVHEGGHLWLGLPDEYMNRPPGCPACVMVGGNMQGFGPGKWKLCDDSNHTAKGDSCWNRFRAKYPNVRHPNPDYSPELPVEPEVIVNNAGQ